MIASFAKTGKPLSTIPKPVAIDGRELPFGSVLDFITVPVGMQPRLLLLKFLSCHGFKPPPTDEALLFIVNKLISLGDDAPPIRDPDPPIGDGRYACWSVVEPVRDEPVIWLVEDEMFTYIRTKVFVLNDDSVNLVFGLHRNGIRNRSEVCCYGGHINIRTMKFTRGRKLYDGSDVFIITAFVTPTVKTAQYWTTIMVDINGKYLGAPYSGTTFL